MEEHIGKKRRKEVRQAINLKQQMTHLLLWAGGFAVLAFACVLLYSYLGIKGIIPMTSTVQSIVPMVIVLLFAMLIGSRSYKYFGIRDEYKRHCKKFNITKQDMKDLKEGRM